jgi:hypothetical protein
METYGDVSRRSVLRSRWLVGINLWWLRLRLSLSAAIKPMTTVTTRLKTALLWRTGCTSFLHAKVNKHFRLIYFRFVCACWIQLTFQWQIHQISLGKTFSSHSENDVFIRCSRSTNVLSICNSNQVYYFRPGFNRKFASCHNSWIWKLLLIRTKMSMIVFWIVTPCWPAGR